MTMFYVYPYTSTNVTLSIRNAWMEFAANPNDPILRNKLCNKVRTYFSETPMMNKAGFDFLNMVSNDELLSGASYSSVEHPGLPQQDTLLFVTLKGSVRVWCSLKSFMNKKLTGELLGYPSCCIDHYCNKGNQKSLADLRKRRDPMLAEIGFIPCPKCVDEYPDDIWFKIRDDRVIPDHYENADKIITSIANEMMTDKYELDERQSNSYTKHNDTDKTLFQGIAESVISQKVVVSKITV